MKFGMQLVLLGINAGLGGLLFGYDTVSMSGALLQIKRPSSNAACPGITNRSLSVREQELVTAFVLLGAFISSVFAGWFNDCLGRRKVLLGGALLFILGSALMASATSMAYMLAARVVVGLGVGIASHTVPLYISECAPAQLRGSFCFLNDLMVVVGQVTAGVVSALFFRAETPHGWRWILGLSIAPATLMFAGFFMQPESPRWLLLKGRSDEARSVLRILRSVPADGSGGGSGGGSAEEEEFEAEFGGMIEGAREEMGGARVSPAQPKASGIVHEATMLYHLYFKDLRTRRALLLGCGLQCLQQWSGINTIMYYGATVLQRTAAYDVRDQSTCFSAENKQDVAITILFALAQMVAVFASWRMVDRVGRRPLILTSLCGVIVCLVMIGLMFHAANVSKVAVVVFTMLYLLSFGIGLSAVPWTVNAEIHPLHVRGQCLSFSTGTNWLMNFVVAQTFLSSAAGLSTNRSDPHGHPDGVFWLYGGIAAAGLALLWYKMPETNGLTLEEIGHLFVSPGEYDQLKSK